MVDAPRGDSAGTAAAQAAASEAIGSDGRCASRRPRKEFSLTCAECGRFEAPTPTGRATSEGAAAAAETPAGAAETATRSGGLPAINSCSPACAEYGRFEVRSSRWGATTGTGAATAAAAPVTATEAATRSGGRLPLDSSSSARAEKGRSGAAMPVAENPERRAEVVHAMPRPVEGRGIPAEPPWRAPPPWARWRSSTTLGACTKCARSLSLSQPHS